MNPIYIIYGLLAHGLPLNKIKVLNEKLKVVSIISESKRASEIYLNSSKRLGNYPSVITNLDQ